MIPDSVAKTDNHDFDRADWEEIHRTAARGFQAWLDEQFDRPIGWSRKSTRRRAIAAADLKDDAP